MAGPSSYLSRRGGGFGVGTNNNTNLSASSGRPYSPRSNRFSLAKILQTLYWYFVFPSLIITALKSLQDLVQFQNYNNAVAEATAGSSTSGGYPGLPRTPTVGGGYQDFNNWKAGNNNNNDDGVQHNPRDMTQYNNNWFGEGDPTPARPSHPEFLRKLMDAKEVLEERVKKMKHQKSSATRQWTKRDEWTPRKPPANQPIDFRPHVLPPPIIISPENVTAMVLVMSWGKTNFMKRHAIRETWGKRLPSNTRVYFVLGQSNCDTLIREGGESERRRLQSVVDSSTERRRRLSDDNNNATDTNSTDQEQTPPPPPPQQQQQQQNQQQHECVEREHSFLKQEQLKYGDLLEIPMEEHYRRLPEKVVQAYHWTLQKFPAVEWVIKADDDMFVRVDDVVNGYLQKYNPHISMIVGQIVPHSQVATEGKWKENDYQEPYYPYWPQGSAGHILSRTTADYIVSHSPQLHRYQGEDVSIGIWMDQARLRESSSQPPKEEEEGEPPAPPKLPAMKTTYIQAKRMITNDGSQKCGQEKVLMIGHDLHPESQYECWKKFGFGNTTLQERAWLDDPAEFEKEWEYQYEWGGLGGFAGALFNAGGDDSGDNQNSY